MIFKTLINCVGTTGRVEQDAGCGMRDDGFVVGKVLRYTVCNVDLLEAGSRMDKCECICGSRCRKCGWSDSENTMVR